MSVRLLFSVAYISKSNGCVFDYSLFNYYNVFSKFLLSDKPFLYTINCLEVAISSHNFQVKSNREEK